MFNHDVTNSNIAAEKAEAENSRGWFARLMDSVRGPMPIVAGSALPSREGLPGRPLLGVNADSELLAKTKHLRHKDESMMEFFARTMIGAHTIRNVSKAELDHLYEVATSNPDYQENHAVTLTFEPKARPTRIIFT